MKTGTDKLLAIAAGVIFTVVFFAYLAAQGGAAGTENVKRSSSPTPTPRTHFLIVGKPKVADPIAQQERGVAAVRKVADAAGKFQPGITVDALAEVAMTIEQYRRGQARETVTGAIFREH